MQKIFIKAKDDYELELHIFKVKNSKAVIQLIHGMEEHQERYESFIKFLNENGLSVVSSNMRGHGTNAPILGHFKDKKGYKELIEDQKTITKYIEDHFESQPIYIFAHSMGTIITRVLLEEYSKHYQKVVLSGYPNFQNSAYIGVVVSNSIKFFKGPKYKSKFLSNLSIGQFNKEVQNPKTDVDWICSNEKIVQEYIADPYCGIGFTCSAFNDLYHLVVSMHKPNDYHNINNELEFLLLRGLEDSCTGGYIGANDSRKILTKAGFKKMKHIDYPDMRHEILNEENKQQVYEDILNFYQK